MDTELMPATPPPHVNAIAAQLRALHPDARIEIEARWFVRALTPIRTSNIGHDLCIDARNLPDHFDTPSDLHDNGAEVVP